MTYTIQAHCPVKFYLPFSYHRDRVPTVLLAEWPLSCCLFDGDTTSGPVPTLFSDRPDSARAALDADPEKAWTDLSKILRKFAIHENVPPASGWGIIMKPRYGPFIFAKEN